MRAQLSFCFHTSAILRGVIGICGGIPGDWETSETYRAAPIDVLHLAGTRDEFYPPERVQDYERQLKRARAQSRLRVMMRATKSFPNRTMWSNG